MRYWLVYPIVLLAEGLDWLFGRLRRVVSAVAVLVVSLMASTLVPPYVACWKLQDEVKRVARRHAAQTEVPGDSPELRLGLMKAVRDHKLDPYVSERDFEIEATAVRLRISCGYGVDVEVLPGHRHTIRFQFQVEEPILPKPGTKFI
ncbi:MAG TPA: hypothetical protein VFK70_02755 [Vicinamibacteria bacterium]|nr:hypothetical protein [Vicinamibacteria bacterium]